MDLAGLASAGKLSSASYKVTEDAIHFATGVVSTREETLPLWAVRDVDLSQTLAQRARGVGDLVLKVDPAAGVYGQELLRLKSIRDPKAVRDLLLYHANKIRQYWNQHSHDKDVERQRASAASTTVYAQPAPVAGGDPFMEKLAQLADMHQKGILSAEEFAAAKARLLA